MDAQQPLIAGFCVAVTAYGTYLRLRYERMKRQHHCPRPACPGHLMFDHDVADEGGTGYHKRYTCSDASCDYEELGPFIPHSPRVRRNLELFGTSSPTRRVG